MPEYLAPGVYVEEAGEGPRPIEGVSTSTAGMAGQTERGPMVPRPVTSWTEYQRWYGGSFDRVPTANAARFLPYAVRGFFENGGQRLFIARVTPAGAATALADLPCDSGTAIVTAIGPGVWGNGILVRVRDASLAVPGTATADWFRLTLLYYRNGGVEPDVIEDFDNLSPLASDPSFAPSVVNGTSTLVTLSATGRPRNIPDTPGTRLQGGTGDGEPTDADYLGASTLPLEQRQGLLALESIDEIALLTIPDDAVLPGLRSAIVQQCERLKDRIAIVSLIEGEDANAPLDSLQPPSVSGFGACYLPWVRVAAPHTPDGHVLVPANGHIAGIYARVDRERGVHKAPANEVVRGLTSISGVPPLSRPLDKRQQDSLNPRGIDVIRDFSVEGRGVRVWGARTMAVDPPWKYVNVRRLFIFIERSIDRGTRWVAFEPNHEPTWASVRQSVTTFLRTVWRSGALMGVTEAEAFFVKCDRTTMTQEDIDSGRLICVIGVAPAKPAEFAVLRIGPWTLDAGHPPPG